jgi:UDP-N-acetylglucosamine acyltransferase
MTSNHQNFDISQILETIPHRYPFLLVDRVLDYESNKRLVAIKNVSVNEPYFQGHFSDSPVMPGGLIIEALAQAASLLLLKNSEHAGRHPQFSSISNATFKKPVIPGDQLRLEVELIAIDDTLVSLSGKALVDGKLICETDFKFTLSQRPSKPQIHKTAFVDPSAILGKNVVVGPNAIIGERVYIGDNTTLEANTFVEKWTRIGDDCHIHVGCVIGSAPQDMGYKGEKSWVVIGDRNEIREYVTINRATGKDAVTEIGNDNLLLTQVHLAHNCTLGSNIVIANGTNIAGHSVVEDKVIIGGMTGVHQFCRIGKGAMVGAYTRLPQDVPPFMMCEGNPATIKGLNSIGLRRGGSDKTAIQEVKDIHKLFFRSNLNTKQALEEIEKLGISSDEGKHLFSFLSVDSKRGITKKPLKNASE